MPAVLALDLGGTKLAAALVDGARVLERREAPTDRGGGAEAWISAARDLVGGWRFDRAGIAVTGLVRDGLWHTLNPATLPVPNGFPLAARLRDSLGVPVLARNDAQAAAWGEYRFSGAGQADMVFVTVSTGIGGGLIAGGRLVEGRTGLAGHIGIAPVAIPDGVHRLEDIASGSALARLALGRGTPADVTTAASRGEPWAEALLDAVVAPLALSLRRLQLELDPDCFVIGGGLGLAAGYLDRLERHLASVPALMRPTLCAAALGADAGLIGIADLALSQLPETHG
jgi:N-acetylmannosamine-6-phosphate 2-epimerase/N-acetylmannosamine kinase